MLPLLSLLTARLLTKVRRSPAMTFSSANFNPGACKVIHIDMDAFFASVEQRDNPERVAEGEALRADLVLVEGRDLPHLAVAFGPKIERHVRPAAARQIFGVTANNAGEQNDGHGGDSG